MGKSPAKWIKTVLFGKKSSRSSASKKSAKERESKNGFSTLGGESPVISYPLPATNDHSATPESRKEPPSNLLSGGVSRLPVQEEETKAIPDSCQTENISKNEEDAAIKVQAAFRGYLARRAFHALWGVIRLQALFRGHLVRRQAVSTLRCIQGIVKLQAIVRGRKVRQSDIGLEVHAKFSETNIWGANNVEHLSSNLAHQAVNFSSNRFVIKLLSSTRNSKSLQIQYANGEPNSLWNWLEKWSSTQFWKPASLPKKCLDSKPKGRLVGYALETESGKLKRGSRRNYSSDNGSIITTSESEKSKRNPRKASTAEVIPEQQQSELEKVKRNLRKITSSYAQASDAAECEGERLKKTVKSVANSLTDGPEIALLNSVEKAKKDNKQAPETNPTITVQNRDLEVEICMEDGTKSASDPKKEELIAVKPVNQNVVVSVPNGDSLTADSHLQLTGENHYPVNGQLTHADEKVCEGTQKTNMRRASFSAKLENAENGAPITPTIPSYMAATESAKAKLRGQISPRFSSDGIDKNGFVRRHSLPSSTNGKLGQRPGQNILKVGRGDRSFSSSKDGNDCPIRVEWRR